MFAEPTGSRRKADLIEFARRSALEVRALDVHLAATPPIPGYDVIREIHRGGQGVVYRAVQLNTGRAVAVKMLREGPFCGPNDRFRFDREIRVLGQLRHPNIVTIHDSGVTSGCHYLVMDFVPGEPFDRYVGAHEPDIESLVRLFVKVCRAVHAAHVLGVIHRDLKPGNIRIDERGEPHILDFGLAKLDGEGWGAGGRERTVTFEGQFVGSLPWSSPEQVGGAPRELDLRSDVYSLGVMLFQALTGSFPYSMEGAPREVMVRIADDEPRRPSRIRPEINRDLETIILRCLEKDRERRYQSAAALAEDLERYLAHEPVLARAPSAAYQVRKLIRRHRLPFALLSLLTLAVLGFAVSVAVLYARSDADRVRAVQAEKLAEQRRAEAERESQNAKAVNDFLINDLLTSSNPYVARGRTLTVAEVLTNASKRLDDAFQDQPLTRATLLATVSGVYTSLGMHNEAAPPIAEADEIRTAILGDEHPDTLGARAQHAAVLSLLGEHAAAEAMGAFVYDAAKWVFGPDKIETLRAGAAFAQFQYYKGRTVESLRLTEEIYKQRKAVLGEDHPETLSSLGQWANFTLMDVGELERAEDAFRRGLVLAERVLGRESPEAISFRSNVAVSLMRQRRFAESEVLLTECIEASKRIIGESHIETLTAFMHLAVMREQQGRVDEAETLARTAVDGLRAKLGPIHPATLAARERLAYIIGSQGEHHTADQMIRELIELKRALWGSDQTGVADLMHNLGEGVRKLGRGEEALQLQREALDMFGRCLPGHQAPIGMYRGLVQAYGAIGEEESARPYAVELLAWRKETADAATTNAYAINAYARELLEVFPLDLRDPKSALAYALHAFDASSDEYDYNRYTLGRCYEANGRLEEAESMLRRALAHAPIEDSEPRVAYEEALVRVLEKAGDPDAAEQVYADTLAARRDAFPPDHRDIAASLDDWGYVLYQHEKFDDAEAALAESLDIRVAYPDDRPWRIVRTRCLLAAAIADQGRPDDAAELLESGCGTLQSDPNVSTSWHQFAKDQLRKDRPVNPKAGLDPSDPSDERAGANVR